MALHNIIYWTFATCCCAYAICMGGSPERWGAAITMAASVLSVLVSGRPETRWIMLQAGVATIDVLVFASFLAIAIVARRSWAIWASGLLLAELCIHAVRTMNVLPHWIYAALVVIWAYPVMASLAVGTWQARRPNSNSSVG